MYQRLIFTKKLSRTDVQRRMTIPMAGLEVFQIPEGEHSEQFDVIDIKTGHSWRFRCSTTNEGFHPRPVLTSGWIDYVREKGLGEGDEVSFFWVEKDGEEGLRLGVQAQKKLIRLYGKDCWTTV